jgi:hypothetical protein
MQATDDFPRRPSPWRRFPQVDIPGPRRDMAGLISQELRLVFSAPQTADELDGVDRLLKQIELKHKRRQ